MEREPAAQIYTLTENLEVTEIWGGSKREGEYGFEDSPSTRVGEVWRFSMQT